MSNTIYGLTSKKIRASLTDEKVDIYISTFVCMGNDIYTGAFRDPNPRAMKSYNARSNAYERRKEPPKYFLEMHGREETTDLFGRTVYGVPVPFSGVYDEYASEDFPKVGTLMGHKNFWKVEIDLKVVEKMRRTIEVNKMQNQNLSIGKFGYDHVSYIKYLEDKDKELGHMFTRGHGL